MTGNFNIPPFIREILIVAIILVSLIGMKSISSILSPILLSIFLSVLVYPFLMWLKKRGLSYNISILITISGAFVLGFVILTLLYVSLSQLAEELPDFSINSSSILAGEANQIIQTIITHLPLSDVANIISTGFFVLFATIFLIYELPKLKTRLIKGLGADNPQLNQMFELVDTFITYFVIRVKVNLFAAIGFIIIFFLFGIKFAILWGILTFFLGFIPYLGIIIASIPPIFISWAKYGIEGAVVIAILFIIVNTMAESVIFPRQTGKGLQLSVFVVFASLFVWGWIIGPIGFLLAVPLTVIVIKYLEQFDETRWLALLMSSD